MDRRSFNRWATPLLIALLSGAVLLAPARLARADTIVTNCGNDAQLQTALSSGGLITFACGTATITLSGPLGVPKDTTIDGGNAITIDGASSFRILSVAAGKALTLTNITLRNASSPGSGGAVLVNTGASLTAQDANFVNNYADGGSGGAIWASPTSLVSIAGGTFAGNTGNFGGATFSNGPFTVSGTTFFSNSAIQGGGGHYTDGDATFTNATFRGNRAGIVATGNGGAISSGGALTVTASLFYTNTSAYDGGAIAALTATLASSSVVSNTAVGKGGGLFVPAGGVVHVTGGEFRGNTGQAGGGFYSNAPSFVNGTLFLGNSALSGGGYTSEGFTTVRDAIFRDNHGTADNGGGFAGLSASVTGATFAGNSSFIYGGGFSSYGVATVVNSTFISNTARLNGGAVRAEFGAVITGGVFLSNTAQLGGGVHSNGAASVSASTFASNTAQAGGGLMASGTATVGESTFRDNRATVDSGGGVLALQATVARTAFHGNSAAVNGGGLSTAGTVTVDGAAFSANRAGQAGGGLYTTGLATISTSDFISNTSAATGGGVRANAATVSGASFVSNTATASGGAVWSQLFASVSGAMFAGNAANGGGALDITTAGVVNSTFAGNQAVKGSVALINTSLAITNSTILNNGAPALYGLAAGRPLRLAESIVDGPLALCENVTVTFVGNNLSRDPSSCGPAALNEDPKLGPLQDNGGRTHTMAPLAGSPAVGKTALCLVTLDQRGLQRTNPCDLGAYETGLAPAITSLSPDSAAQLGPAFTLTVNGTGFISGTVALWNGTARATTVLNRTTLAVTVPASDLQTAGAAQVQARYGLAPDSTSNSLPFTVVAGPPPPSPSPAPGGSGSALVFLGLAVKAYSGGW